MEISTSESAETLNPPQIISFADIVLIISLTRSIFSSLSAWAHCVVRIEELLEREGEGVIGDGEGRYHPSDRYMISTETIE